LSIVGQAVAELHLGRLPEAEAALSAAIQKYPDDAQIIANMVVLNVLSGKEREELIGYVALYLGGFLFDVYMTNHDFFFPLQTPPIHPALSCPPRRSRGEECVL
jgi:hypothetical protein